MKIKVNIPGFGERYCSNNVEYKLFSNGDFYRFYKKGTNIVHNEYGPAVEYKDGSYRFFINGKCHRLNEFAFYDRIFNWNYYCIFNYDCGKIKEEFIKKLSNILIPK